MNLLKEFKTFAVKGNVMDMAVGIIIGAAFGKVVSSLVGDVIMPPVGLLVGGVDFSDLAVTLQTPIAGAAAVTVRYGRFIQTVVDFTVVAFSIFVAIKLINSFGQNAAALSDKPSSEEKLLTEIRDLLRERR